MMSLKEELYFDALLELKCLEDGFVKRPNGKIIYLWGSTRFSRWNSRLHAWKKRRASELQREIDYLSLELEEERSKIPPDPRVEELKKGEEQRQRWELIPQFMFLGLIIWGLIAWLS